MMVSKVRGRFGGFTGTVTTTEDGLGSSVDATVDMASVDTGDANETSTCGRRTSSTWSTTRR